MSIDELKALVVELSDSARDVLEAHDALVAEHEELQRQYDEVYGIAEQGADAEQALFAEQGRRAFDSLARELGIKPGLLDAAWATLGYEGDVQDRTALEAHVREWAGRNPDFLSKVGETAAPAMASRAGYRPIRTGAVVPTLCLTTAGSRSHVLS